MPGHHHRAIGRVREVPEDSAASLKDRVKVAGRRAAYPFRKTPYRSLKKTSATYGKTYQSHSISYS